VHERELELTRAYLAAIVESSDDAIISKDLNGVVRSFNSAAERLFGYSAEEIIGRPVTIIIPSDRQHEEAEILARLRRGEKVDHFETVRLTRDARPLDVSLSVSPVRDSSGAIIGAAKILRDITQQKHSARELAAQHEWFRVTLGSVGDAVITSDPQGRVTFMNAVAEKLTGWTSAEALGRELVEVFHIVNELTREPVEHPAGKVIRHGVIVGLANHTVLIARDGTECPIDDSAAPILDDQQRIIGVVLVFHDVTEQRRAAAELAEQREWLETTLQSIGDGVIATDIVGNIVFMNPVAEHLTGWKAADAKGSKCGEVFHIVNEVTRRETANPVSRVLLEGQVVGLANHTVLIAADGTERAIDDSGSPIRNTDEKMSGVVLVFRDVTERREAERERQAAALEREELLRSERIARADAERANRVKDQFVAMVSHELRTPLGAIVGWTTILQAKPGDLEMTRHGLEIIARNARLQGQLVSDLLDMSRIASDKLLLQFEPVRIDAILTESIESVQPLASERGVTLQRLDEVVAPETLADPARLKQVVGNLLTNAIKFTPTGGQVDVRLRHLATHVEIVVKDTGIGINAEELGNLFERFHQVGPTTTRRYGGLGLGLTISKHLLELHGGHLRASSEGEGKGATFTVELPLTPPKHQRKRDEATTSEELPSLRGITVLVVEDEPDMRSMIEVVLAGQGAHVRSAGSAVEALDKLSPEVDLLLSDIRMPDVDGYELIRRIRERQDATARIPAVALTAFARSEDRARAMRAGFQGHIAKPFETSELLVTLASFADIIRTNRNV
jgi:PAS domain S-box-containing protein